MDNERVHPSPPIANHAAFVPWRGQGRKKRSATRKRTDVAILSIVLEESQGCFYVRWADYEKSRRVEERTLWWVRESEQEHDAICFMSGRHRWDRLTAAFARDHNPQTMTANGCEEREGSWWHGNKRVLSGDQMAECTISASLIAAKNPLVPPRPLLVQLGLVVAEVI